MAFEHILDFIRPGITELDVARELGYTMEKLGGDDHHYNFIVASGKNSALPHGFATNKVLEKGDFLTMDFGAVVHGYFADMTRTVALGSVSEEQERIYNIVYEAQQLSLIHISLEPTVRLAPGQELGIPLIWVAELMYMLSP